MYLIHSLRVRRRHERLIERQTAAAEQAVPSGWQPMLTNRETVPRPHARPIRQVVREERTHGGS